MRRGLTGLAGLIACGVLASCSTQPATDVGATTATLNGTGVTGAKAMVYWFQYAPIDVPLGSEEASETPHRGPAAPNTPLTAFSEAVTGLTSLTGYHYRACGTPVGETAVTCVSEETFATRPLPDQGGTVRVTGRSAFADTTLNFTDLDLEVDTADLTAARTLWGIGAGDTALRLREADPVECAVVSGHKAIVALRDNDPGDPPSFVALHFEDNGGGGRDRATFVLGSGSCTPLTYAVADLPGSAITFAATLDQGRAIVAVRPVP